MHLEEDALREGVVCEGPEHLQAAYRECTEDPTTPESRAGVQGSGLPLVEQVELPVRHLSESLANRADDRPLGIALPGRKR